MGETGKNVENFFLQPNVSKSQFMQMEISQMQEQFFSSSYILPIPLKGEIGRDNMQRQNLIAKAQERAGRESK